MCGRARMGVEHLFYCVEHTSHILGQNVFCHDSCIFSGLNWGAFWLVLCIVECFFCSDVFYHFGGEPGISE